MEQTDPVRLFIDWKKRVCPHVFCVLFQGQSTAMNVWAGQWSCFPVSNLFCLRHWMTAIKTYLARKIVLRKDVYHTQASVVVRVFSTQLHQLSPYHRIHERLHSLETLLPKPETCKRGRKNPQTTKIWFVCRICKSLARRTQVFPTSSVGKCFHYASCGPLLLPYKPSLHAACGKSKDSPWSGRVQTLALFQQMLLIKEQSN